MFPWKLNTCTLALLSSPTWTHHQSTLQSTCCVCCWSARGMFQPQKHSQRSSTSWRVKATQFSAMGSIVVPTAAPRIMSFTSCRQCLHLVAIPVLHRSSWLVSWAPWWNLSCRDSPSPRATPSWKMMFALWQPTSEKNATSNSKTNREPCTPSWGMSEESNSMGTSRILKKL